LLWQLIEVVPYPTPYTLAWNMVNLYAKVDLLEFELGNEKSTGESEAGNGDVTLKIFTI
jgi:hypothetical protein